MITAEKKVEQGLLTALQKVIPSSVSKPVPLHEPAFLGNELKYVSECIETGWVSSVGKYVDQIEQMLCQITGAKYAVAMVNGTAALHMAFLMANVQYGDEVLMPALTFIATANAATYCGATPNFLDSDLDDLGVCPVKLKAYLQAIAESKEGLCYNKQTGKIIRALCVTHIFGIPAQLKPIKEICDAYGIALIEDAAEALGSYYHDEHVGHYGLCGVISFNGNKITTTGGGGALLTDHPEIAKRAKHLSTTGKIPAESWEYRYDVIGYNYRMPNINAALGCAQLEKLSDMLQKKRVLAERYHKVFEGLVGLTFKSEPVNTTANYWLNAVQCDFNAVEDRNHCLVMLNAQGYGCRPIWELLTDQQMYQENPQDSLTNAHMLARTIINLPSGYLVAKELD